MGYVVQFSDGRFLGTDSEHAPERPMKTFADATLFYYGEAANDHARELDWEELSEAAMPWKIRPVHLGPPL